MKTVYNLKAWPKSWQCKYDIGLTSMLMQLLKKSTFGVITLKKCDSVFCGLMQFATLPSETKWAATRQNLSSGFLKNRVSNQSPQLQRLPRNLKFRV